MLFIFLKLICAFLHYLQWWSISCNESRIIPCLLQLAVKNSTSKMVFHWQQETKAELHTSVSTFSQVRLFAYFFYIFVVWLYRGNHKTKYCRLQVKCSLSQADKSYIFKFNWIQERFIQSTPIIMRCSGLSRSPR